MREFLARLWCSLNYRYCKSNEYLAHQRGDAIAAADFYSRADEWQRQYMMIGRRLI